MKAELNNILFLLIVFLTNIIQAITGFAGTMLAMPFSILLIGINEARAILNVLGLLSCLLICFGNYKNINKKELIKIISIMTIGMIIGGFLTKVLPLQFLLKFYGFLILFIALKKLFVKKEFRLPNGLMIFTLLAAGIIHSIFISGGSLLVIYAVNSLKDKNEFRATVAPVWIVLNGILMVTHFKQGFFNTSTIQLTLVSIIPLIAAIYLGNLLHRKIKQESFLKLTYVLLIISGVSIII